MEHLKDQIRQALRGLDYPATRSKLISVALENGAPPEVVDLIRELPETADFLNEDALERTFGVRVRGEHPHGWE